MQNIRYLVKNKKQHIMPFINTILDHITKKNKKCMIILYTNRTKYQEENYLQKNAFNIIKQKFSIFS